MEIIIRRGRERGERREEREREREREREVLAVLTAGWVFQTFLTPNCGTRIYVVVTGRGEESILIVSEESILIVSVKSPSK
jgi:hypothetical protein